MNIERPVFDVHGIQFMRKIVRIIAGVPASHGCVGLYDEEMQKTVYGFPRKPELTDAKKLFEWVLSPITDDGKFHVLENGPVVWVVERVK